jgi:hypothetical protein
VPTLPDEMPTGCSAAVGRERELLLGAAIFAEMPSSLFTVHAAVPLCALDAGSSRMYAYEGRGKIRCLSLYA